MHLAHRRLEHPRPATIALAKVAVGVPGGVRGPILGPEQLQGDPRPFEFLVQMGPRRDRPVEAGRVSSRVAAILGVPPYGKPLRIAHNAQ